MRITHEFSIYYNDTTAHYKERTAEQLITLSDDNICYRILSVLRLKLQDIFILFDRQTHMRVVLKEIKNKKCILHIITHALNEVLVPEVIVWIPLLKKDDLEQAVYEVAAAGASEIQLVVTNKIHKNWYTDKELMRLERIIIAAAEQSKCYHFALIHKPLPLQELKLPASCDNKKTYSIFADPLGKPLLDVMSTIYQSRPQHIVVFVGPEGGLANEEKEYVRLQFFEFCALTRTILRSKQALSALTTIVRS